MYGIEGGSRRWQQLGCQGSHGTAGYAMHGIQVRHSWDRYSGIEGNIEKIDTT